MSEAIAAKAWKVALKAYAQAEMNKNYRTSVNDALSCRWFRASGIFYSLNRVSGKFD